MKARLILNKTQRLMLLCEDGTIEKVTDNLLYNFLTRFNQENVTFSNGTLGSWKTEYCPDMTMYPGKTVAFIADNKTLIIQDFAPFMPLVEGVLCLAALLLCTASLVSDSYNPFLYFRF